MSRLHRHQTPRRLFARLDQLGWFDTGPLSGRAMRGPREVLRALVDLHAWQEEASISDLVRVACYTRRHTQTCLTVLDGLDLIERLPRSTRGGKTLSSTFLARTDTLQALVTAYEQRRS